MGDDMWRQWQAYMAAFNPLSPASQTKAAHGSAAGFTPFIDAAEAFAVAARAYFGGAAKNPTLATATNVLGDFLREQFADFQMPWSGSFNAGGGASPASFFDFPALGATREHQQRLQRMAQAWRRMDEAQRRLQRLWSDALREAAGAFAAKLVPPPAELSAEGLQKLYDAWIDCAEDAYARAAHTDVFSNTLAEFVNASSAWRRDLQASMEQQMKLHDLPTRSELNTLMRRMKAVEERLHATHSEHKPAPPTREPAPSARRKRKLPAAARPARRGRGKAKR